MYCYILDTHNNDWIESEDLYPTDIALLIDNEKRKIYLYNGPQSVAKDQEIGASLADTLVKKYEIYTFETLQDLVPIQIQVEIERLMGSHYQETRYKEPRNIWMTLFLISNGILLVGGLLFIIAPFFLFLGFYDAGYVNIAKIIFDQVFFWNNNLWWVLFGASLALLLWGLLSKHLFLGVSGIAACLIAVGIRLYLLNGILIFDVAPQDPYQIRRIQLVLHIFWLILGILALSSVSLFPSLRILKETERMVQKKMNLEEMRKKSKPTILQDIEPVKMEKIPKK